MIYRARLNSQLVQFYFTILVVGSLFGILSHAQEMKLDFPVEKFTLSNGMTVLLHENRTIPMISYQTWFRVGSRDENKSESGLAHMLEHMMFKGAKKYSNKEFDRILHENGITNNAFTTFDYTGYYENLPSSKLELIMDVEVDRLTNLSLRDEDLQKEREVVMEERRMRVDNDPNGAMSEALFRSVFTKHPYGSPTIGTMEDIKSYTEAKLKAFFAKWYTPSNAILVLVGDFDTAKTKKMIEKYYGGLPGGAVPPHEKFTEPDAIKDSEIVLKKEIKAPWVSIGYKTPGAGQSDSYVLDLLSAVLGQGKSSRLFKKMVYEQQTSLMVSASNYTPRDYGIFSIECLVKAAPFVKKIGPLIELEIEKIQKQGITANELTKVKNQVISDYVNSLRTNDGKARILALNEVLFSDYKVFFQDLEKYKAVTSDLVKEVANRFLKTQVKNTVVLLPEGSKVK